MKDYEYNDNELLYLINQKDDDALEILINKYKPLINRRIRSYKIRNRDYDDYYQECLITFINVIKRFREDKNGIFNLYLDCAIRNTIKSLMRKEKQYFYNVVLCDELEYVIDEKNDKIYKVKEPLIGRLSKFEKEVYHERYINGLSVKDITKVLGCSEKRVYNAITRMKRKLSECVGEKNNTNLELQEICFDKLSLFEQGVIEKYMSGVKTKDIALIMGCSYTQVLNALGRAKRKMKYK